MILTDSVAIGFSPNPFYKASKEEIEGNWEYARKCYHELIPNIINYWCITQSRKKSIISADDPDTVFKEQDKILSAIKDHKIDPLPDELKELVL